MRCGKAGPIWGREIVMNAGSAVTNVVLVHGGFVDGSGWRGCRTQQLSPRVQIIKF
jgi:hypothetical protein